MLLIELLYAAVPPADNVSASSPLRAGRDIDNSADAFILAIMMPPIELLRILQRYSIATRAEILSTEMRIFSLIVEE